VNLAVDACSLINLSNAGALSLVCRLTRCRLWLCSGVAGECGGECAVQLLSLVAAGDILRIEDAAMPAARVLDLLDRHGLGQGETEAIAACEKFGYTLCSDDGPARALGTSMLGAPRVIGSIRLLQWCVEEQLVECLAAFGLFGTMRDRGGFLPKMERTFFCADARSC
jgi:predicted nucleic acid-binding protein